MVALGNVAAVYFLERSPKFCDSPGCTAQIRSGAFRWTYGPWCERHEANTALRGNHEAFQRANSRMTALGDYLDTLRRRIRNDAQRLKNLGKPHSFPCPYCTSDVSVSYKPDGSADLRHRPSECKAYSAPDKHTRGDLVHAFVFHCRPQQRYGALDGLEDGKVFK